MKDIKTHHRLASDNHWPFMPFINVTVIDHAQFMNTPVQTDKGKFGARIGDGDVSFFMIPKDLESQPLLRLVAITDIDDPKYSNLPLY